MRYGQRPADDSKAWSAAWWQWVRGLQLPHVEQNTTLLELILEVDHQSQRIERFDVVPSEYSSGPKTRRGAITKTGNSHLRRALVESAWHYRHRPKLCKRQQELQSSLPPKIAAIAWSAQERLHRRYWALSSKSKPSAKIVTALAR